MNLRERMEIEYECSRLVTLFHICADKWDHETMASMFTEDAVLDHIMLGVIKGRPAIKAYYDSKETNQITRHMTTNILIDVIDADHARGQAYFTMYGSRLGATLPAPLEGPVSVGNYVDEFVRTVDGWKFSFRQSRGAFLLASNPAPVLKDGSM